MTLTMYHFDEPDAVDALEFLAGEQLCLGEILDNESNEWLPCGSLPASNRGFYCDLHKGK